MQKKLKTLLTSIIRSSLRSIIVCLLIVGCKKDLKSISGSNLIKSTPEGMIWVPGGDFYMGAPNHDYYALSREKPNSKVDINGFYIDITEVTNQQFSKFVDQTGYITLAERPINWKLLKKDLPQDISKPKDSLLQPGSLTFKKPKHKILNLQDISQWWQWTIGANWRHPQGSNSSIKGKEHYPVVHIAYEDAIAYCEWANRRLPTEAEWEYAARGNTKNTLFFWGDNESILHKKANTWEGQFPNENIKMDGYEGLAPIKSYDPNSLGLYDMAGNVWEWTSDTFRKNDGNNHNGLKIIKGGSFLCSKSYCYSYRLSAKMPQNVDSSSEHIGFRTVLSRSKNHSSKDAK